MRITQENIKEIDNQDLAEALYSLGGDLSPVPQAKADAEIFANRFLERVGKWNTLPETKESVEFQTEERHGGGDEDFAIQAASHRDFAIGLLGPMKIAKRLGIELDGENLGENAKVATKEFVKANVMATIILIEMMVRIARLEDFPLWGEEVKDELMNSNESETEVITRYSGVNPVKAFEFLKEVDKL